MSWNIPLCTNGFPAPLAGTLPTAFKVSKIDLYWAALTVGRPNLRTVLRHKQFSIYEAIWRIGMINANLDLSSPMVGLYHSSAFNALDPTEKGWVNFSLGMVFAKICAAKFLSIAWLMHFKWFQARNIVTMLPGGSTPDFIGVSARSGQHHVIEAKGRNSGFSQAVLDEAKAQATQAVSVNGSPCGLHVGTLMYRMGKTRIAMAMEDPKPEDRPKIELIDTRETWREYYETVWQLARLAGDDRAAFKRLTGLEIEFEERARTSIESIMTGDHDDWQSARDELIKSSGDESIVDDRVVRDKSRGSSTYPDGVRIIYTEPMATRLGGSE